MQDRPRNLLRALEESQDLDDTDFYTPESSQLRRMAQRLTTPPLCIFYSTNRSVIAEGGPLTGKAVKNAAAAAYADALVRRSWNITRFADWMRAQVALASESLIASQHVIALQTAASRFLPEYSGLRIGDTTAGRLVVDKGGEALDMRQLSDGERGILAMVLDLASRLSQANPGLSDPLEKGQAVVLIDEIELHLHPRWQRQIVRNLTDAFPRCQFIATTHSPQVIGEVAHDRIQIIANGQVYSPTHSYGVDSSRVLEEIMDVPSRTESVQESLTQISHAIGMYHFDAARSLLSVLVEQLGEDDPEVTRVRTLLAFM